MRRSVIVLLATVSLLGCGKSNHTVPPQATRPATQAAAPPSTVRAPRESEQPRPAPPPTVAEAPVKPAARTQPKTEARWEDVLRRANELARREVETEPERTKQELAEMERIRLTAAQQMVRQFPVKNGSPRAVVYSQMRQAGLRALPDAHQVVQGQATPRLETALHLRFDAARLRGERIDVGKEANEVLRAWRAAGGLFVPAGVQLVKLLEEYYLYGPPVAIPPVVEPAYRVITRDGRRYTRPDGKNTPAPSWYRPAR